jgi:glucose-6-phosphate dehydrogenase assembly protein OpcA
LAAPVETIAPPEADARVIRWSGAGIKVDEVAARLLDLRQSASDEEGYPLTRASVMNLIVFAADPDQIEVAVATVDELALRHPSRGIVVAARPGRAFSLSAEVAIHSHPLATHGLVYERVVLYPVGADPEGLDTLVIPLLIPHLQSFLWWLGRPDPEDPALRSLASFCDRLILDSSAGSAAHLKDISERLGPSTASATASSGLGRLVIGDMTWTRLDPVREALARIFDEGGRASYLEGIERVEITGRRGVTQEVSPAEVLLGGWLASRLGCTTPTWTPAGVSMRLEGAGRRVIFNFSGIRGYRSGARGNAAPIASIRVIAELGRKKLTVSLRWQGDEGRLSISETGEPAARHSVALPQPHESEVLSRELARLGRDRVFEDAMASAARIQSALTS